MAGIVNLQDIVDDIDMASDEFKYFLDKETGKVTGAMIEELGAVEDGEDEEVCDETAFAIVTNPDRYVELPGKRDFNEWEIMREFCETVEPASRRERLLRAIHGSGAFRYFKDLADDFGIIKDWYAFKEDALREIAREWCEDEGLPYTDKRRPRRK